jgi:hypothetical protein
MLVFLSWSGDRSKSVADALAAWLVQVIQSVDPWLSSEIDKGARWGSEIAGRLEQSKVGIICLTQENLVAPWILFEAGALSKMTDAYACTLLLDVVPADVKPPLGQFQHTSIAKDDVRRLIGTINKAVEKAGEKALTESVLDRVFETNWSSLEAQLAKAASEKAPKKLKGREDRELLEEILDILRGQERRHAADIEMHHVTQLLATMRDYATHSPNRPRNKEWDRYWASVLKSSATQHHLSDVDDDAARRVVDLLRASQRKNKPTGDAADNSSAPSSGE